MLKAYKYRLLPTDEQAKTLDRWMGMCRFIYNLGLETKIAAWQSANKNYTAFDLMKQVTELKKTDCIWLAECVGLSLEAALTNLDRAFKSFYKGGGYPKFKNKFGRQSITFRRDVSVKGSKVRIPKIGLVDFIQHRPLGEGEIRTCVVSKTPANGWFISILVKDEKELPEKQPDDIENSVGVDVGIKIFATLSDGQKFDNPKYLHNQLKRLRVEQRKMQRRFVKGAKEQSKSYQKQKLIVAKLHEKIANQRKDFLHKVSTAITKQYDTVCLEDLNVTGMMKNGSLSKSIADVSWSEFGRMLEYKSEWYGKNIRYIGLFEPSSKMCYECGEINQELKLSDRDWTCSFCGSKHDRDFNAANNIKNIGFKAEPSFANATH